MMDVSNPYTAPQTGNTLAQQTDSPFGAWDDKAFNKLYYRSCNVSAIAFLLGLGLLFIGAGAMAASRTASGTSAFVTLPIFGAIAAFYLVAMVGLVLRSSWGRILGIIICIFSLISIPIGTIVGAAGLFALFGAPQLFGAGRLLHKDLKVEFKLRKKLKKEAKRQAKLG